jgi:Tol biopolymer transport system component
VVAQIMEMNARQLTLFDRQGRPVTTVGTRDLYNQPVFSPDATRMAVVRPDLEKETQDLWVIDNASGKAIQLTVSKTRENAGSPAWSPDGKLIAYVALRDGYFGLYRKASNAQGDEELLYKGSAPMTLTDWSQDGKYLTYFSTDLTGGGLYALPLAGTGERKPIEVYRNKSQNQGPRLSPDSRIMTYTSNVSGRTEVYAIPFDPAAAPGTAPSAGPWQISDQGGGGMVFWRKDGRELYYLAADRAVMVVAVTAGGATPTFAKPQVLFRPAADIAPGIGPGTASVSRDGERFVIAVPRPQLRQLTVYDRSGKPISKVGEPGFYNQPNMSPDGTRAVVMRVDPRTGNNDIWTVDLASGRGTPITNDNDPQNAPIWSPDGTQVAYVSTHEGISSIYRKAADGAGEAVQVFNYTPGAGMVLTDWSPDNKFMTFHTGVIVLVPLAGNQASDRKEIDWLREDYDAGQGRFSPDNRYIAFMSNEADVDRGEVYVRPFDPNKPDAPIAGQAIQVSKDGAIGMIAWRQDGKELYFMTRNWEVMAVDVETTPTFKAGTPKMLFSLPGPLPGNALQWKNVSPDGQRFLFAMPASTR